MAPATFHANRTKFHPSNSTRFSGRSVKPLAIAGVYLMSGMEEDHEWTSRVVFAEQCNPNADDFNDEIAVATYGTEETAELIPLDKLERNLATAKRNGQTYLTVSRSAAVSR